MNNDKHTNSLEAHDIVETMETSNQLPKLPYHAPQLTVHGKLERITQSASQPPLDDGGGI